jgi:TRAP-type C4-dicarboxylate transport system permease small subunit
VKRTATLDPSTLTTSLPGADPTIGPDSEKRPPRLEWWMMIIIMLALAAITFLNVIVRYLTNASFAYTEELSVALMIALVLAGTASAVRRDRHIRVTFVVDRKVGSRRMSDLLTHLATLATFGFLGYYGVRQTMEDIEFGAVSAGLGVPEWWFSVILPIGCALVCWRAIEALIQWPQPRGSDKR